jgi:predicted RNase H-like nuclease (RuvC/YqgF family)
VAKDLFNRIGNVTDVTYEGNVGNISNCISYIIYLDNIKDNVYSTSMLDKTIKKIDKTNGNTRTSFPIEILKNENNGVPVIYANATIFENEEIQDLKSQIQALKSQIQALKSQIQALKSQIQALKSQIQALSIETQLRKEMITALSTQPKKTSRW